MLSLALAVAARATLMSGAEAVTTPGTRASIAAMGMLFGVIGFCFGLVVLFQRRKAWLLAPLVCAGAGAVMWLLNEELSTNVRDVLAGNFGIRRAGSAQPDNEGVEIAREGIPQEKNALTFRQIEPAIDHWAEKNWLRPYEEHGHHDPAWDDTARQLIRGTALQLAGTPASPGAARLRALGFEIRRTACDDPWVLFLAHRFGEYDPDFAEVMVKSAKDMKAAGYPAFPQWLAHTECLRALRNEHGLAAGIVLPECLETLRHALSDAPLESGDYYAWAHVFTVEPMASLTKQDPEALTRAVESVSGLEPWFAPYVRGKAEIDAAWQARGSGWANTVSDAQWALFGQHLSAARKSLEYAIQLNPKQPEPGHALIRVALGADGLPRDAHGFRAIHPGAVRLSALV